MELFVFIVFQLLIEVQSNNAPTVHVSPAVFSESRSVQISCETPADITVKHCDFTINRKQLEIKVSPLCELNLTGAEVLRQAGGKSPQSVNITCCYTIKGRRKKKSSDSVPATVTVLDQLQKPVISVTEYENHLGITCKIPLSVRADFTCSFYYEDDAILVNRDSQWRSSVEKHICVFNPTLSDLLRRSVKSRKLSCDYSLKTEPDIRSPHSDTHIIEALPQARLSASASVLRESDTVELSCGNTEELKMEMCVFNINGRETYSNPSFSCQLSLNASQISVWSEDQRSSVRITCFYVVKKGQFNVLSPPSDPVTVTVQISSSTTALVTMTMTMESTASTSTSTSESTQIYSTAADLNSKTNLSTSRTIQTTSDSTVHTSTDQPTTTKHTAASTPESTTKTETSVPYVTHTEGQLLHFCLGSSD
uniref:Si:ch211-11c3.9 n=1 Tax=Danio rerio TaxID=7955 RepID=A0A0R4ILP4_DANRE|nr:uncharacterized serine-rich protein C215.13-like [Danio rerio]|eukprot:XP_017213847.2 uncharacterized serine-rich protein C215.13-like [Danio rerio]